MNNPGPSSDDSKHSTELHSKLETSEEFQQTKFTEYELAEISDFHDLMDVCAIHLPIFQYQHDRLLSLMLKYELSNFNELTSAHSKQITRHVKLFRSLSGFDENFAKNEIDEIKNLENTFLKMRTQLAEAIDQYKTVGSNSNKPKTSNLVMTYPSSDDVFWCYGDTLFSTLQEKKVMRNFLRSIGSHYAVSSYY